MPVTRIRRGRNSGSKLTGDQVQHLVEGWSIDPCLPYHGRPGFPFRDEDQRRRRWVEHRADLVRTWGAAERMAAWRDYDGSAAQREAFNPEKTPRVWLWRSVHGDDGQRPHKVAEVIPLPEVVEDGA